MSSYEILPCRLSHIRRLAATLRAGDRAELMATGRKPRHVLLDFWRRSYEPRTALVDGEVAGCWGDAGEMLSADGWFWFFTAPPIERVPLAFAREGRRELARMLRSRRRLLVDTRCEYIAAQRLARLLGFHVAEPDVSGWCRMILES
jgi:hypothetical protein